jgi:hypothetical protein
VTTKRLELLRISLKDLLDAYPRRRALRLGLSILFCFPALAFSVRMARFSRNIGKLGLREAARRLLEEFYAGVRVCGNGPPAEGGLLVLSNHPGVGDSLALIAALERTDVRIVAGEREFFRALPGLASSLIPVPEDERKRIGVLRAVAGDLRAGRTVILYPAGRIEPDPLLHPERYPLEEWSSAVGLLVVLAAREGFRFGLKPALVGGVLPARLFEGRPPPPSAGGDEAGWKLMERRAVGRIIGLAAARRDAVTLAWGRTLMSDRFAGLSAEEITARVMDEASGLLRTGTSGPGPWSHPSRETPRRASARQR